MKNSVTAATGIKAYALVTEQAATQSACRISSQARSVTSRTLASSARRFVTFTIWPRSLRDGARRAALWCSTTSPWPKDCDGAAGDCLGLCHRHREEDPLAAHRRHDDDRTCPGRVGRERRSIAHMAKPRCISSTAAVRLRHLAYPVPMGAIVRQMAELTPLEIVARICRCAARSLKAPTRWRQRWCGRSPGSPWPRSWSAINAPRRSRWSGRYRRRFIGRHGSDRTITA